MKKKKLIKKLEYENLYLTELLIKQVLENIRNKNIIDNLNSAVTTTHVDKNTEFKYNEG
jgi:hypothetical protein